MIFDFYPGGMYHRGQKNQKNHFHSDEGGVKMIFLIFNFFLNFTEIENLNFLDFNGLLKSVSD